MKIAFFKSPRRYEKAFMDKRFKGEFLLISREILNKKNHADFRQRGLIQSLNLLLTGSRITLQLMFHFMLSR
jgi:hypothetical protein